MEIKGEELTFERLHDENMQALKRLNCNVREIDQLIHNKSFGLRSFISENDCEAYIVCASEIPVAIFVYSFSTIDGGDDKCDALEIDFIAVSKDFQHLGIGRRILDMLFLIAGQNGVFFVTVDAFFNKQYSACGFYEKCGFQINGEKGTNIIPMLKVLP